MNWSAQPATLGRVEEIDPQPEYERRRTMQDRLRKQAQRQSRQLAIARSTMALAMVAGAWVSIDLGWFSLGWLVVAFCGFLALVLWHERVRRLEDRARRGATFYSNGLARIAGDWRGTGSTGEELTPEHHLYAVDLDILGEGSLFQLLSRARTQHGERTLARWLLTPTNPEEIRGRQKAIRDLRDRLDLREDLALAGQTLRTSIQADRLAAWGEAPGAFASPAAPILAALSSACTIASIVGYGFAEVDRLVLLIAVSLQAIVYLSFRASVDQALAGTDRAGSDLGVLAAILARIEAEPLRSGRAKELQEALQCEETRASVAIHNLRRRIEIHDSGRNLIFAPVAIVLLWPVHGAWWIDHWRKRFGTSVSAWLDAVGEFEALSSLACQAFENPGDAFAEVSTDTVIFSAEELGHPLLPAEQCVRNDVTLSDKAPALVVSGSNMSGKTTLLRAIGTNAVLGLAGGTVRARHLHLSPMQVGASIRTQDSLLDGRSRFQAEIDRIHHIMEDAEESPPLLFLLDEVLAGTNSHDRQIGARAILTGLLDRGALGLVTTHDLALAEIETARPGQVVNVHFEDHLADGEICFDYKMRPGVVERSNAIELMRAVGLPV